MIELHLGLALETSYSARGFFDLNRKRRYEEAFEAEADSRDAVPRTLPLLRWDHKQPNEDDDPNNGFLGNNCSILVDYNKNEGDCLVGWPPVKTLRKKTNRRNHGNDRTVENGCDACRRKSTYVKVKMEGVAIARKIDLSSFDSLESLTNTLIHMFDHENWISYRLIYKDREGDWLVAGDVPWRNFIRSANLLKLQKING